jgi:prevent-host-death family protein
MRTLSLADAKAHLSAVVDQAEAGEEIVITRRGRPVARIVAARKQPAGNTAALVKELQAFVMAQPLQKEPAAALVRRMRESGRY